MPKRIQLKRAKGWRKPEGAIVCTRPGFWGNPLQGDRAGAWFRVWLHNPDKPLVDVVHAAAARGMKLTIAPGYDRYEKATERIARLPELRDHDLCCFCGPEAECHVDVLIELANGER